MKILIGMPSYSGMIPLRLVSRIMHLEKKDDWAVDFCFTERVGISKARNAIAKKALDNGYDFLLFIDDDQLPPRNVLTVMIEQDKDILCCPIPDRNGEDRLALFDECLEPLTEPEGVFKIGAGGMGTTLIKGMTLEAMFNIHQRPFDEEVKPYKNKEGEEIMMEFSEDINFCVRAGLLGHETWCVSELNPIHFGKPIEFYYDCKAKTAKTST